MFDFRQCLEGSAIISKIQDLPWIILSKKIIDSYYMADNVRDIYSRISKDQLVHAELNDALQNTCCDKMYFAMNNVNNII